MMEKQICTICKAVRVSYFKQGHGIIKEYEKK